MSDIQINQLLSQMREMATLAENRTSTANELGNDMQAAKPDFGQLLKDSINHVNETQKTAASMATAFEAGDPNVNLSEVMVSLQKASVSFQAMTQVRNNLVSAYKEIMNMQV